jgi:hypothetical protein
MKTTRIIILFRIIPLLCLEFLEKSILLDLECMENMSVCQVEFVKPSGSVECGWLLGGQGKEPKEKQGLEGF